MVRRCFLCHWRSDKAPLRSFHKFPTNKALKQKWLDILGKSNSSIGPEASLCFLHFEENCFQYGLVYGRRMLKSGSVPSLHFAEDGTENKIVDFGGDKIIPGSSLHMELNTMNDVQRIDPTSKLNTEDHPIKVKREICSPEILSQERFSVSSLDPQPHTICLLTIDPTSELNSEDYPIEVKREICSPERFSLNDVQTINTTSELNSEDYPIEVKREICSPAGFSQERFPVSSFHLQPHTINDVQTIDPTCKLNTEDHPVKVKSRIYSPERFSQESMSIKLKYQTEQITDLKKTVSELKRTVKRLSISKFRMKAQLRELKKKVFKYEAGNRSRNVKIALGDV